MTWCLWLCPEPEKSWAFPKRLGLFQRGLITIYYDLQKLIESPTTLRQKEERDIPGPRDNPEGKSFLAGSSLIPWPCHRLDASQRLPTGKHWLLGGNVTLCQAEKGRKDILHWAKKLAQMWDDVDQPGTVFKVTRASGLTSCPPRASLLSKQHDDQSCALWQRYSWPCGRGEVSENRDRVRRHCKARTQHGQRDAEKSVCLGSLRKQVVVKPPIPGPSGTWDQENKCISSNLLYQHSSSQSAEDHGLDVAIWQEPDWCFHVAKVQHKPRGLHVYI